MNTKRIQPDPTLLTPREAAELLHVSTETIRNMIQRKELQGLKVGSQWRVYRSEVTKLMASSQ